jgi:hypothetical protein
MEKVKRTFGTVQVAKVINQIIADIVVPVYRDGQRCDPRVVGRQVRNRTPDGWVEHYFLPERPSVDQRGEESWTEVTHEEWLARS